VPIDPLSLDRQCYPRTTVPRNELLPDSLVESAAAAPSKAVIMADDGVATYDELLAGALAFAGSLQDEGLRPGERVALFMENSLACSMAVFGVALAGGVFVTVNPQTKAEGLARVLEDSGARFLVAEGPISRVAAVAARDLAQPPALICARPPDEVAERSTDFHQLLRSGRTPVSARAAPSDLAALLYTSGSEGTPKGVMHTHESLTFVTGSIARYLRLGRDDRILNVLPVTFGYGLSQLLLTVRLGATLLLERSFAFPAKTLRRIEHEDVTVLPGIPTMFATLASIFAESDTAYPSVTRITNAAAGLPPSLHAPITSMFPNALVFRMYGQTECIRVCYLEPELIDRKPTSVGKAIPGTDAFVLDEHRRAVAPGEVGTLYVRGQHLMTGYWNAPERTARALQDGLAAGDRLLCTHDLFTVDEDGDLYFVSRTDEIIKTRGQKVSPAHVENVLFSVTGVKEAAAVGVPDELLGEAVHAYVVLEPGVDEDDTTIMQVCRERLEAFAVPQAVHFIPELPKTATGKVRRRSLLAAEGQQQV
jgi:acyl-CoA synthetase (AMP-forming)/AMP-acid ligase II